MPSTGQAPPAAYRVVEPWVRRSLGAVRGVVDGVWLGVFTDEQLDALDTRAYDARPRYADDAYNSGGLHAWERRALDAHFPCGGRIVVIGAGGGREVLALLRDGYDAVGYECHPGLSAYGARFLAEHGYPNRVRPSRRNVWPEDAGRCDGVVVGWGSYTHIPGRGTRVRFLRGARMALRPGGPVLLSFWTVPAWTPYLRAVQVTGSAVRRVRGAPPLDNGDALAGSYVHHFTRPQVERELSAAGFVPVHYRDVEYGVAVGTAAPTDRSRL
jgi:hypothetical protein